MKARQGLVLAVHPTSRGFGWVIFENALSPVDWGLATVKARRTTRSLARFERLLNRYEPVTVVFEQFSEKPAKRADRIRELCEEMIALASTRDIDTPIYDRDTIRHCFKATGARTRREVALSIAEQIEAFRHRLPRKRKRWNSEDVRQSLFDAVALVLTHFAVTSRKNDHRTS
jgi:Holliday junction resolvasome RuvABC endonuclease subunit